MIGPLRKRHGRAWLFLAVVVPGLYAAALLARPEDPRSELPPDLARTAGGSTEISKGGTEAGGWRVTQRGNDYYLELVRPSGNQVVADGLLYYSRVGGDFPHSQLIGAWGGLSGGVYPIPAPTGRIHWYSLVEQKVVLTWDLPLTAEESP